MRNITLEIYYLPLCCPNNICGPRVDPELERFFSCSEWLKNQNVEVIRYDLSSYPAEFVGHESVKDALEGQGKACLPLVLINGYVVSKGTYPDQDKLMPFLEIAANEKFGNNSSDSGAQCCDEGGLWC